MNVYLKSSQYGSVLAYILRGRGVRQQWRGEDSSPPGKTLASMTCSVG